MGGVGPGCVCLAVLNVGWHVSLGDGDANRGPCSRTGGTTSKHAHACCQHAPIGPMMFAVACRHARAGCGQSARAICGLQGTAAACRHAHACRHRAPFGLLESVAACGHAQARCSLSTHTLSSLLVPVAACRHAQAHGNPCAGMICGTLVNAPASLACDSVGRNTIAHR
jgi:hypothetical protein